MTFQGYRKRNNFLPHTNADQKWKRYTLAESTASWVLVDLTRASISAQRATDIAMALLGQLEKYQEHYARVGLEAVAPTDFAAERVVAIMASDDGSIKLEWFGMNEPLEEVVNGIHGRPVITLDLLMAFFSVYWLSVALMSDGLDGKVDLSALGFSAGEVEKILG